MFDDFRLLFGGSQGIVEILLSPGYLFGLIGMPNELAVPASMVGPSEKPPSAYY